MPAPPSGQAETDGWWVYGESCPALEWVTHTRFKVTSNGVARSGKATFGALFGLPTSQSIAHARCPTTYLPPSRPTVAQLQITGYHHEHGDTQVPWGEHSSLEENQATNNAAPDQCRDRSLSVRCFSTSPCRGHRASLDHSDHPKNPRQQTRPYPVQALPWRAFAGDTAACWVPRAAR